MAKTRNTFEKRQREMEKKRKADEKRERRRRRKQEGLEGADQTEVSTGEDSKPAVE